MLSCSQCSKLLYKTSLSNSFLLGENRNIQSRQHGFGHRHSTANLLIFVTKHYSSLIKHSSEREILLVVMDISKARASCLLFFFTNYLHIEYICLYIKTSSRSEIFSCILWAKIVFSKEMIFPSTSNFLSKDIFAIANLQTKFIINIMCNLSDHYHFL